MKVSCLLTAPLLWAGMASATVCKPSTPQVCQNILSAPDFSPSSAWIAYFPANQAPADNSWTPTAPCGDYDSCVQITAHQDTALSIQSFTYPYSGAYTASLKYKVLNAGDGSGNLKFGLVTGEAGVTTNAVTSTWETYTIDFTANAGGGSLYLAYTASGFGTIQVTDVQIIACQ
ncbi:hypothetical protein Sste5346_008569 [Sporothrix stenoceras]|uniref:CBM-cenC domain-containing protein n=1 Tax=Sporothrix stenoceras TaxID=5173 RepID=A0ABR3YNP7_9PEZI